MTSHATGRILRLQAYDEQACGCHLRMATDVADRLVVCHLLSDESELRDDEAVTTLFLLQCDEADINGVSRKAACISVAMSCTSFSLDIAWRPKIFH